MATDANTSNNSIVISDSDDEPSDSDSTDYEPEPKRCKLGSSGGEGADNAHVTVESNSVVSIPIRATTTVEFTSQVNGNSEEGRAARTNINGGAFSGPSGLGMGVGERQSFFTVGDLVQQTLEASLGRIPSRHTSPIRPMSQQLEFSSQRTDPRENRMSQAVGISTPADSPTANPRVVVSIPPPPTAMMSTSAAGDFPTIAREVVVRMDGGTGSASQSQRRSHGRRRRSGRRRHRRGPLGTNESSQQQNNDNASVSGSSSSYSSSEYFTDDIDPMEIPSDEYLSPPFPSRQGQRRNAIFVRRDPPTAALVPNEDDQYYHNELEVASVLDINENPIEDGSSTSGVDDELLRRSPAEPVELPPDETDNNFADNETVKSDLEGDSEPTDPIPNNSSGKNDCDISEAEKSPALCSQCRTQKPEPCFRYCLRCFKIRRTWLPPRPASRRLKSRKALLRNSNPNSLNNSRTRSSSTSEGEDVVDGGHTRSHQVPSTSPPTTAPTTDDVHPGSSTQVVQVHRSLPSSQPIDMNAGFLIDDSNPSTNRLTPDSQPGNLTLMELFTTPEAYSTGSTRQTEASPTPSTTTISSTSATVSSQSQSQSGSSQSQGSLFSQSSLLSCGTLASSNQSSSPPSQPQQTSSPLPKDGSNDIVHSLSSQCSICCVRDKDAAFVHNKIAHLYCCYTCADKILKKNGKCPICRERVLRVVKIISV